MAEAKRIVRANIFQRSRLSRVLADAFAEDPLVRWILGERRDEPVARERMFCTYLREYQREGLVETTGAEEGAALWGPPGYIKPTGMRLVIDGLRWLTVLRGRTNAAMRFYDAICACRPQQHHWYLATIGTPKIHQGKGVASALLQARLRHCDDASVPAYLESSNAANLPLYQKHGFVVLREFSAEGSPTLWLMLREPAAA